MFNKKPVRWPLLLFLAALIPSSLLSAQNPLRPNNGFVQAHDNQPNQNVADRINDPDDFVKQANVIPQHDSFTSSASETPRNGIALMGYQEPREKAETNKPIAQDRNVLIGSAEELPWQDPNRILDLIMNISLNLVFVLSFAFGAILLARKWMQPSSSSESGDRLNSDKLSVLQTLRIEPKISIRLIQWRSNRFLVSCDQNGIQSVNVLNGSFDQTLTEMEADDQLVSKLLASLESNRT